MTQPEQTNVLRVESCSLKVVPVDAKTAADLVISNHYLHRRPPISSAFGIINEETKVVGVVTFGVPASRQLQIGACRSNPDLVIELNRLWVDDALPKNVESWFVSKALKSLPARVVVSYADTTFGHLGYVYRAMSWNYAGWTDMDRKTPRYDYIPIKKGSHTRESSRSGYSEKIRRKPKIRYWTTTGTPAERRTLTKLCTWPQLSWIDLPPPRTMDETRQ